MPVCGACPGTVRSTSLQSLSLPCAPEIFWSVICYGTWHSSWGGPSMYRNRNSSCYCLPSKLLRSIYRSMYRWELSTPKILFCKAHNCNSNKRKFGLFAQVYKKLPKNHKYVKGLWFMENRGVNVSTGLQTLKLRAEIENVWEIWVSASRVGFI